MELLLFALLWSCRCSNQIKHGRDNIQCIVVIRICVFVGEFFNPLTQIPICTNSPLPLTLKQGIMEQLGSVNLFFQLP